MSERIFPVIEDLPEPQQRPFMRFLARKTRPINKDGSIGYYVWDYKRWLEGLGHRERTKFQCAARGCEGCVVCDEGGDGD